MEEWGKCMQPYQNLSGESGVRAYEIGDDYIKVEFSNGTYLYTYQSAGEENIETMKQLAEEGRGLNRFINRVVKELFESKYPTEDSG